MLCQGIVTWFLTCHRSLSHRERADDPAPSPRLHAGEEPRMRSRARSLSPPAARAMTPLNSDMVARLEKVTPCAVFVCACLCVCVICSMQLVSPSMQCNSTN